MVGAIRYGLANLTRFSGRDPRGRFWPYAAVVVLAAKGVQLLLAQPLIAKVQTSLPGKPPPTSSVALATDAPISLHALYPDFASDLASLTWKSAIISMLMIALLAAAVSRRLHDAGRTAYFGALPLLFMAFGLGSMRQVVMGLDRPNGLDGKLIGALAVDGLLYVAAIVALIVVLASASIKGPNLHGPDPHA